MEFRIHRDMRSLMFVRCIARIPGSELHAEAAAFSIPTAIEKCRSESEERGFLAIYPRKRFVLGIAAHPDAAHSKENAISEALETLVLHRLVASNVFYGIPILRGERRIWLGRTSGRFFCLISFPYLNSTSATHAVSRNPFTAILRAWTEYRNIKIYQPRQGSISTYTKANRILGPKRISALRLKVTAKALKVDLSGTIEKTFSVKNRIITTIEENV